APFAFGLHMGSRVYATRCKARRDTIVAMLCVDSIGCFSSTPGSQRYPALVGWMLRSTGDFVGFASNLQNQPFLDHVVEIFRRRATIPSVGVALNSTSVYRSDHASFWEQGYPAVIISDTCDFRDKAYHTRNDTADRLNYDGLTFATEGLMHVVRTLAGED